MQLLEEKTAFIQTTRGAKKVIDYTSDQELTSMKNNQDIKSIETGDGKKLKEEAGRKYTAEESAAVGKTVGKSLLKVLRGQGDEVVDIRLTGVGLNKFGIKVKYGNDKGKDTFRFTLNPDTEDITLDLGRGNHEQLVDFVITQGNTVSLPTPELEDKLSDAMKKYTSEPSPEEYDQMAAMEPESDPSQINKYISEEMIDEILFTISGLGDYKSTKQDADTITGIDQGGTVRTFTKKRVAQDNPGIFDKQPRERKPQGVRPYTEAQYRKILQGAIDDAGSTEFAYDMADSMIYDPQILARLKKDYPGESARELKQQLQYDLEACDAPDDDYEDDEIAEKKLTKPEVKKREEIVKAMKKEGEPKDARTYAIATAQAKKLAEKLDPVGKEDSDINNDGKVDLTDKYLGKRRQAVASSMKEDLDLGHEDDEPGMLLSDIYGIMQSAKSLYELVSQFKGQQEVDFPHWWQAKIVNAKANLSAARQYLDYEVNKPQQVNIAAVALEEGKSTCCHKCGHVHVKGTAHPTPYLTGQKNCKFRD